MRVLSGIQPSGRLHLGNYFGAMRQHIALQEKHQCYFFIADLHSLTTVHDRQKLAEYTFFAAVDYLAFGLDPEKVVFFRQSDVPEVCELYWILSNVTPLGLLERSHSYKEKLAQGLIPNHGLFSYPVLMAADILLYQSDLVPVGQDQKQHIEITRDIAQKFNNLYGEVLKIPRELISKETAIVPGIDGRKMSKSYQNTIPLFLEEKALKKKVFSIKTDSKGVAEAKDPKQCNLFALYKLLATDDEIKKMSSGYQQGGLSYKDIKEELLQLITDFFAKHREAREKLISNKEKINNILNEGAMKARITASETLDRVKNKLGLTI